MIYLIWSYKRNAWWRTDSQGYTWDVTQAGQYGETEANDITRTYAPGDEERSVMVEARLVYAMFELDTGRRKEEELVRRNVIRVRAREAEGG